MNGENNFLDSNEEGINQSSEIADILNEEPKVLEEYPVVGGYDRDALIQAIKEARD